MPDRSPLIYPDSCIYLDAITRNETPHGKTGEPRWKIAKTLFRAWQNDHVRLASSPLVEAEVLCKSVERRGRSQTVEEALRSWFNSPNMRWVDIDRFIAREAVRLREEHGHRHLPGKRPFGGADALHLAAALRARCDYFMTYDGGFPYDAVIDGMKIQILEVVWPEPLFDP